MKVYLRIDDQNSCGLRIATMPPPKQGARYLFGETCTVCLMWPYVKETLLSIPSFPAKPAATASASQGSPYSINSSNAGGGHGVFATRKLLPGDRIIIERPLFLYPAVLPVHVGMDPSVLLDTMINQLCGRSKMLFNSLHNCKSVTSTYSRNRGLLDINSIGDARVQLPGPHEEVGYAAGTIPCLRSLRCLLTRYVTAALQTHCIGLTSHR